MGVNCSAPIDEIKTLGAFIQKNESQAHYICEKHKLGKQFFSIICRTYQSKQEQILINLQNLMNLKEKKQYLLQLQRTNLQLLDSLYYNLILNGQRKNINIKTWDKTIKLNKTHEFLNQIGFSIIRQKKAALLIMAGGKNFKFGKQIRQTFKLDKLPSKKTPIQILLQRSDSLGSLLDIVLDIIIMLSESKQTIQTYLQNKKYPNLKIKYIYQCQMGILDMNGKLVLENKKQVYFNPNGTGDFLPSLQQYKILEYLKQRQIQYLQIISSNNLLEFTFDYRILGFMKNENLDIVSKCVDGDRNKKEQTKLIEINKKLYIIESNQYEIYKQQLKKMDQFYGEAYTFTNCIVFKIQFLLSILKNQNWNYAFGRCYRPKKNFLPCYNFLLDKQQIRQVYVFQKDLTDLFLFTDKYKIIYSQRNLEYSPIINKNSNSNNILQAILNLSNRNKGWLKIKNSNANQICEISPYISVWGQNLQQIIQDLSESQLKFPLYIHPQ